MNKALVYDSESSLRVMAKISSERIDAILVYDWHDDEIMHYMRLDARFVANGIL